FVPGETDVAVERLVRADALVIGKTAAFELGYGPDERDVTHATVNPWNPRLTSGGSSSGSAVAVATGIGPVSVGTDGGGSIRVPASFRGVLGFKPSAGRVPAYPSSRDPRYPGLSSWESLGQIGPLSRTVADAALVLDVITGPDGRDPRSIPT